MDTLASADNPTLVKVRRLLRDGAAYRRLGWVWLEGDHLLQAALQRGWVLDHVLASAAAPEDAALMALMARGQRAQRVAEPLWRALSSLESPPRIGALCAWPAAQPVQPGVPTVVLDRLQDAGNAGSILRSAAALGVRQVLALSGTVALWSPKVLRAGMGAHFALHLVEGLHAEDLAPLAVPWVGTSSHVQGGGVRWLHEARLPHPCAWIFGHEGGGVAPALLAQCTQRVAIQQPGGEESLNVAAAAAVCLYEAARQQAAAGQSR